MNKDTPKPKLPVSRKEFWNGFTEKLSEALRLSQEIENCRALHRVKHRQENLGSQMRLETSSLPNPASHTEADPTDETVEEGEVFEGLRTRECLLKLQAIFAKVSTAAETRFYPSIELDVAREGPVIIDYVQKISQWLSQNRKHWISVSRRLDATLPLPEVLPKEEDVQWLLFKEDALELRLNDVKLRIELRRLIKEHKKLQANRTDSEAQHLHDMALLGNISGRLNDHIIPILINDVLARSLGNFLKEVADECAVLSYCAENAICQEIQSQTEASLDDGLVTLFQSLVMTDSSSGTVDGTYL